MYIKYLYIILLSIFSITAFSQSDTLNQKDANNKKQGYWIFYYDNNVKKEEGRYVNNKKEGVWKAYYQSGKIKHEITYVHNKPNGYAKFYYENGKVSEEGIWKINKWVGEYKMYHKNGNLSYEWKYNEQGKRTGVQKYYHDNGQLMIEGNWKDGKEDGVLKEYDKSGKLISERTFHNGQQDNASVKYYNTPANNISQDTAKEEAKPEKPKWPKGYQRIWLHKGDEANKKLIKEGIFVNNKLKDGKWYHYDEDGNLTKTVIYKDFKVVDIQYN